MFVFMIAAICGLAGIPEIREIRVEPTVETPRPNLVANYSFEEVNADGVPCEWTWSRGLTDATVAMDEKIAHSGRRSIHIVNGTPLAANIYATLAARHVSVKPNTRYTLSFYARSDDAGAAWLGGGRFWQFRLLIETTGGQWQRYSGEYMTAANETTMDLRVLSEGVTSGFWVDDIKLEEGSPATFCEPPASDDRAAVSAMDGPPARQSGPWQQVFDVFLPAAASVKIAAELRQAEKVSRKQIDAPLSKALSRIIISGQADQPNDTPSQLIVRVESAAGAREATANLRFFDIEVGRKRLVSLIEAGKELGVLVERARSRGMDPAYPLVGASIVQDFTRYVREDLDHGQLEMAFNALRDLETMTPRIREELQSALEGRSNLLPVPRYAGGPIHIEGPNFLADARWPVSGMSQPWPIIFTGYGHFDKAREYADRFPDFGANLIQIEIGPQDVLRENGTFSDDRIKAIRAVLDRAGGAHVAVCLLISPHYMPAWVLDKHPEMKVTREGFLRYSTFAPAGHKILRDYARYVAERLGGHPALHSICLSNEPINTEGADSKPQLAAWHDWLAKRHGDIARLDEKWKSSYPSFDKVPVPDKWDRINDPIHYEFILFNQDAFTAWHQMLADAVHEAAPQVPVHCKAMTWNFFSSGQLRYGVSAERFAEFSQIHGNDSFNLYNHGRGPWAQSWDMNNRGHDLQRSAKDCPVFNSENHLIRDGETRPIPPEHIRSTLWLAAMHGQSATTIWVWDRTYDPHHDFAGSIMTRPLCVEAAGRTGLDLLRLGGMIRSIQGAPPAIGIFYSQTATIYDGDEHTDCLHRLYTALSFSGQRLVFLTDRQLANGEGPRPPLLFVPNVRHVSDAVFGALQRYPGQVVLLCGPATLDRDEYGQPRQAADLPYERIPFDRKVHHDRNLWETIIPRLAGWNVDPVIRAVDMTGQPVWGVEWLAANFEDRIVVHLAQHGHQEIQVQLLRQGTGMGGTDLLTGERLPGVIPLKALSPRFIMLGED